MGRYIPRYKIDEELLKKLRIEGLTYKEISDYLEKEKGIRVSIPTICKRLTEITKSESSKKEIEQARQKGVSDEELLRLKQEGLTYQKIRENLKSRGIDISLNTIRKRIMGICELKKIEVPESKKGIKGKPKKEIPENILKQLAQTNWNYRKMANYLKENGITDVSYETVRNRVIEIRSKKSSKESKLSANPESSKSKIIEQILKLKESRNATDDQIIKIAKSYGINLSGTRINKPLLDEEELEI